MQRGSALLVLALAVCRTACTRPEIRINLDERDTLEIPIDKVSSSQIMVNSISANTSPYGMFNMETSKYTAHLETNFAGFGHENINVTRTVAVAAKDEYLSYLVEARELVEGEWVNKVLVLIFNYQRRELEHTKAFMDIKTDVIRLALNDTICTDIVMDKDQIYAICIDEYTQRLVLATSPYRQMEASVFRTVPGQYLLPATHLQHIRARLHLMQDIRGVPTIAVYISQSPEEFFQRRFLIFRQNEFQIKVVPVLSFIIDRVQIVSINRDKEVLNLLISNLRGTGMEVFDMTIKFGYIDNQVLKKGLLATNVHYSKSIANRIFLVEVDAELAEMVIHILDVHTLGHRKVRIPNQLRMIKLIGDYDFALVETITANYMRGIYILDLVNWKECDSSLSRDLSIGYLGFLQLGQESFLSFFDHTKATFNLFQILPFHSFWVNFNSTARAEVARINERIKLENENRGGGMMMMMFMPGPPNEEPPYYEEYPHVGRVVVSQEATTLAEIIIKIHIPGKPIEKPVQEFTLNPKRPLPLRVDITPIIYDGSESVAMLNQYLPELKHLPEDDIECNPHVIFGFENFFGYVCAKLNKIWMLDKFRDPDLASLKASLQLGVDDRRLLGQERTKATDEGVDLGRTSIGRRLDGGAPPKVLKNVTDDDASELEPFTLESETLEVSEDPFDSNSNSDAGDIYFGPMRPPTVQMERREFQFGWMPNMKPTDISDHKIFNERFLVMLTRDCRIYYVNLADYNDPLADHSVRFNDDLVGGEGECSFSTQAIVRRTQQNLIFNFVTFKNSTLFTNHGQEFSRSEIAGDNIANDLLDRHTFVSLNFNEESQTYSLIWESHNRVTLRIGSFPRGIITPRTRMFYIYPQMVVLVNMDSPAMGLVGVYQSSFIYWSHEDFHPDNVERVLQVVPFGNQPLFMLCWQTPQSVIYGVILRFSINAEDRIVAKLMLESGDCPDFYVSVVPDMNDSYHILSICRGNNNYVKRYDFNPNGPFHFVETKKDHLELKVHTHKVKLHFSMPPKVPESAIHVFDAVLFNEPTTGSVLHQPLENFEYLSVSGSFEKIDLSRPVNGITFVQRAYLTQSQLMLQDSSILVKDLIFISGEYKYRPIFSFDNYYFFEGKLELNNNVRECRPVEIILDHPRSHKRLEYMMLCRSSIDRNYILTNSNQVRILFSHERLEPNSEISSAFLAIFDDESVVLIVHYTASMMIRAFQFTFDFDAMDGEVQSFKTLSLEMFPQTLTTIESIYAFAEEDSITLFYHLKFSSEIWIKSLDRFTFTFDPRQEEVVRFFDVRETVFYSSTFFREKGMMKAFLTTEMFIYEIKFLHFNEWDYTVVSKYFVRDGLAQSRVKITYCKQFVAALVNNDRRGHNIFLYRRNENDAEMILPYFFIDRYTMKLDRDHRPAYFVLDLLLIENKISHETFIYVVTLLDPLENSQIFNSMYLHELRVGEYSLDIDYNEVGYLETLRLNVTTQDGHWSTVKMNVKVLPNFKYGILLWILMAFIVMFVVLVMGVIHVHKQNVKLQRRIEAKIQSREEKAAQRRQQEGEREEFMNRGRRGDN